MPDPPAPGSEEEKIIINASRSYALAMELCDRVKEQPVGAIAPEHRRAMIRHLNAAEDHIDAATREYVRGVGYTGPVNHALHALEDS